MRHSLRIIYMAGGASYTLNPLKVILESKHNLVHVYTKYPKPSGRGKKYLLIRFKSFWKKKKYLFLILKTLNLRKKLIK